MLEEIINDPDLQKYVISFKEGQILFLEGDDTQDLYILVSGRLDILKGSKKMTRVTEKGTLFGEISFLLGTRRTATVKAADDVRVIRIPKEEINDFLLEFPVAARTIARILAQRLDETSQILYGLEEFCDQLPDAVILTDRKGKILMWNATAEKLYGRTWTDMRHRDVIEIYEEPEVYRDLLREVESRYSVSERVLKVRHPEKALRYISTSTTLLYDGQHNCQGVLSLGRDVTTMKTLEKRRQRVRYWLVPIFVLLAALGTVLFFEYPYFSKGFRTLDVRKLELKNLMAKDYLLLESLLAAPLLENRRKDAEKVMREFFQLQDPGGSPYTGLVLLDREKRVFCAVPAKEHAPMAPVIGDSYAGIDFKGSESSIHRVLVLYRADKANPMGHKGVEVAFEIWKDRGFLGWLLFQMDMAMIRKEYGVSERDLQNYQFKKP